MTSAADTTALIEEARGIVKPAAWIAATPIAIAQTMAQLADVLEAEVAKVREYENAICWDVTCLNCSKLLDRSYADYVRAAKAEARSKELTDRIEALAEELQKEAAKARNVKWPVANQWSFNPYQTQAVFKEDAAQRLRALVTSDTKEARDA